ncbi:ARM repeat superfamily protein [Actinidia rufa]|uniref:ARM repeat superfamily protein n=1 Tax=Actinidia rufa TaxID=165716 RepID=A0A7J0G1W9_9ERIC|nr:ARM repeat superfamily protein [Actinidia rufa]
MQAKLLKTDIERSNVSANFLNIDVDRLKVIRKEARNTLLELAKDECYRILVMEEGLLLVPLVGTTAYKSFRPPLDSRPSWPDGTLIEWTPKVQSKYGASEVLLGLRCRDNDANMEEAKINAMAAQSRQRFLARAGCIEMENGENSQGESSSDLQFTILPLLDGVARLVLILGLEDESAIARAAESIAGASISNHMRVSFKEAGAVKHLVRLLGHRSDAVRLAVIHALERLSVSNGVCRIIEVEGVLHPLIDALKNSEGSDSLMEKTLNILARILDPSNEMKSKEATRKTGSFGNMDEILVSKSTSRFFHICSYMNTSSLSSFPPIFIFNYALI